MIHAERRLRANPPAKGRAYPAVWQGAHSRGRHHEACGATLDIVVGIGRRVAGAPRATAHYGIKTAAPISHASACLIDLMNAHSGAGDFTYFKLASNAQ